MNRSARDWEVSVLLAVKANEGGNETLSLTTVRRVSDFDAGESETQAGNSHLFQEHLS